MIAPISAHSHTVQTALCALNNASARETSFLTVKDWQALVAGSFAATCITGTAALLIALDQDAEYGSTYFIRFQVCRPRFVYVDRIVISKRYRGRGFATCLYHDLFERASAAGHDRVVCEVNLDPPNPGSDAFHEKMGFVEVGRAHSQRNGKTLRYWEKFFQHQLDKLAACESCSKLSPSTRCQMHASSPKMAF